MTLLEIVESLERPADQDDIFATQALEDHPGVRIGVDSAGGPALFFEPRISGRPRRRILLAFLSYTPDIACRLDGNNTERLCTVLRCTSPDTEKRDLFLRLVDSWLPTLQSFDTGVEVDHAVARLTDLFDALERPGTGEVLGLWGELFVMLAADDPREVLRTWRCDPFERHDFVATSARLEVKTTVGARRHQFSLEQLQPPADSRLIVASVVTKPSPRGLSVDDLRTRLVSRINDPQLAFRIDQTIASTLGDRWKETTSHRYAADLASESLAFFDSEVVPRVDPRLPPEVSQVRFAVELDALPTIDASAFPGLGRLSGLRGRSLVSSGSG